MSPDHTQPENPLNHRLPEPEWMDLPEEAEAYARADFDEVNAAFVARILDRVASRSPLWALDLGTGPGDIPCRIAQARPTWRLVAVDASLAMLGIAGQRLATIHPRPMIFPVQADAKRLGLADGCFDLIYSNSILHHITEVDSLWAQVVRVARPGAVLFFRDLLRPATDRQARAIVENYAAGESAMLQEEFYRSLRSAYSLSEVREQLNVHRPLARVEVRQVSDRHLDIFGMVEK